MPNSTSLECLFEGLKGSKYFELVISSDSKKIMWKDESIIHLSTEDEALWLFIMIAKILDINLKYGKRVQKLFNF